MRDLNGRNGTRSYLGNLFKCPEINFATAIISLNAPACHCDF